MPVDFKNYLAQHNGRSLRLLLNMKRMQDRNTKRFAR